MVNFSRKPDAVKHLDNKHIQWLCGKLKAMQRMGQLSVEDEELLVDIEQYLDELERLQDAWLPLEESSMFWQTIYDIPDGT